MYICPASFCHEQDETQSILSGVKLVLYSEFPFSKNSCCTKAKEPSWRVTVALGLKYWTVTS